MIADPAAVLAMTRVEEHEEQVILQDGMRVEHVTVEPLDVVTVEEAVVLEEESVLQAPAEGSEETVLIEVGEEGLKEQTMEVHLEQVTEEPQQEQEVRTEESVVV